MLSPGTVAKLRSETHLMPGPVARFIADPDFERLAAAADRDPEQQALLAMEALAGVALDPLQGETPGCFYRAVEGRVSFTLGLDRLDSPFTEFSLPGDAPEADGLIRAIEANLAGRRFRAAACARRLERLAQRLRVQARDRAEHAALRAAKRCRRAHPDFDEDSAARCAQAAREAYEGVYASLDARVNRRLAAVIERAAPDPRIAESPERWLASLCFSALRAQLRH